MASQPTERASGVTDSFHDGDRAETDKSPLVNNGAGEEVPAGGAPANAPGTEAVVAKAIADERVKQFEREVDKQTSSVIALMALVLVWCVMLGVILLFAFSSVNRDVSIAVFVLGILICIIGIASVCFKSRGGTITYVIFLAGLAIFIIVMWFYYIFVLYKASLAAVDAASNKLNRWVEDQKDHLMPQLPGGLGDLGKDYLKDKDRLEDFLKNGGALKDQAGMVNMKAGAEDTSELEQVASTLEPCQEGVKRSDSKKYLESIVSAFLAMASYGQMCSYSHHDVLKFKKWKYNCWNDCAFSELAVNRNLDLGDTEDVLLISKWMMTISKLPNEQAASCLTDGLSTACVVENENFLYIMLGIVCLFLICACCTCLCCTPASMGLSIRYANALKRYNAAKQEAEKASEAAEP
ncbi:transmembrane protein [Cystoisospora suis]|uniref:Transmembrane protein n=1 Tax=Cystoisospora suis TaxID=483139 RepID=A0A2C6KU30_9APIC|nr:transmembrane protein [Cystoisospora suis]